MTPQQAALAQSGIQAAADVGSGFFGYLSAEKTREFNRVEAQKARDWSYQMWLKQNEYDSPSAKMQRLVAAGLNPNLAYGSLDAMGNPVHMSEQASSSAMSPVPSFTAPDLVQAKLAEAEIKNLNSQQNLNMAEAWRIYKITPAVFQQIQNDSDLIRQKIESGSYIAAVEKFKAQSFSDNGFFTIEDENGRLITDDLKSLILDTEFKRLYATDKDYELAIKTFMNKVGLSNYDLENARLSNQDLAEFVKVCSRIYDSQAKQADYLGSVAELNKDFFNDLGASSDLVKLIYGFLNLIIGGVSNFTPHVSRSTKTIKYE